MSLFAGSVYSSPGVVQAGIKGGNPTPQQNFSTVIVSTCTVADDTLSLLQSLVSNNTEGASVLVKGPDANQPRGIITMNPGQLLVNTISGFNGLFDISGDLTNIGILETPDLEFISSIGKAGDPGVSFASPASVTNVLNMKVSSINGAGPVTYTIEPTTPATVSNWSTLSTSVTTLINLDPSRLHNVTYTGKITTMIAPSVTNNDTFFLTANSGTGLQYSSVPLRGIVDLCAGSVSSFSIADTFTCQPRADSTITLAFGTAATYDAGNTLLIDYGKILVTNLGVTPV